MSKGFFQKRERLPEDVMKGSNESFIRTRYSPAKDSVTTVILNLSADRSGMTKFALSVL
jgi:hypothetical protein